MRVKCERTFEKCLYLYADPVACGGGGLDRNITPIHFIFLHKLFGIEIQNIK